MAREPAVAGQFYAADSKELKVQVKRCFFDENGPGRLPQKKTKKTLKAIISPHAGYIYSGPCATWGFLEIAESTPPDCFIIIGPNHSGLGRSSISESDYSTPLGTIETDKDISELLFRSTDLVIDNISHTMEHSVEVQIPFLQFVLGNEVKIVPIVLGDDIDCEKLGKDIKTCLKKTRKKITFIISSDLTHLGFSFGYTPFKKDIGENMYKLDHKTIDIISRNDAEKLKKHISETGSTVCGILPIITLLSAIDAKDIKLLKYYTSGDLTGDYSHAVGYASIAFR